MVAAHLCVGRSASRTDHRGRVTAGGPTGSRKRSATAGATLRSLSTQDQTRGRYAGARGDDHMLDVGNLIDGRAAQLTHSLGDAIHPVDVGLAQLASVRVDRQPAADLDSAV